MDAFEICQTNWERAFPNKKTTLKLPTDNCRNLREGRKKPDQMLYSLLTGMFYIP